MGSKEITLLVQVIGGKGGTAFEADRTTEMQFIKRIDVWTGENMITCLKLTFLDGETT